MTKIAHVILSSCQMTKLSYIATHTDILKSDTSPVSEVWSCEQTSVFYIMLCGQKMQLDLMS